MIRPRPMRLAVAAAAWAPVRPNAVGISCVRRLRIDGNALAVVGVDIVDGAPRLDIKPYVPEFDCHAGSRAGWFDESSCRRRVADERSEGDLSPLSPANGSAAAWPAG